MLPKFIPTHKIKNVAFSKIMNFSFKSTLEIAKPMVKAFYFVVKLAFKVPVVFFRIQRKIQSKAKFLWCVLRAWKITSIKLGLHRSIA